MDDLDLPWLMPGIDLRGPPNTELVPLLVQALKMMPAVVVLAVAVPYGTKRSSTAWFHQAVLRVRRSCT